MDCENVRMSCIFDTAAQCKLLVFVGEEVEHALAADEGCCAERDIECFVGTIIVPECLAASLGNSYSQQSCYTWRKKVIQRSVNMPAVKASKVIVIFLWDGIAVEGAVVGVFELDILEALVGVDKAVSDDLDLRLVRDGFEVWMEMLRLASTVLPWPYCEAEGSKRWVSSYCAFGVRWCWFLTTTTRCLYRASLIIAKTSSGCVSTGSAQLQARDPVCTRQVLEVSVGDNRAKVDIGLGWWCKRINYRWRHLANVSQTCRSRNEAGGNTRDLYAGDVNGDGLPRNGIRR